MRKLQCLLFLLKRSCTCYYLIFMTVPLRNSSHFEILYYREIKLQIAVSTVRNISITKIKEITVRNKGITICIFFTLISCLHFFNWNVLINYQQTEWRILGTTKSICKGYFIVAGFLEYHICCVDSHYHDY